MGCSGIIRHTYRVPNATFVQMHYFIDLLRIFVNICDIAIIGNVYVLLCLKKLLQWAARWPPFIILTGQQVMEAAPAKYIFMRHPFNRKHIWDKYCLPYPPLFSFSTSSPKCLFLFTSSIFSSSMVQNISFYKTSSSSPFPFPPKRSRLPSIFKSEIAYFVFESSFWMTPWWHISILLIWFR